MCLPHASAVALGGTVYQMDALHTDEFGGGTIHVHSAMKTYKSKLMTMKRADLGMSRSRSTVPTL